MWLAIVRETSIRRKDWGRLLAAELLHLLRRWRRAMVLELCVVGHGCLKYASTVGLFG
jgi:hypothetical protein